MQNKTLLLAGCGRMGGALLAGWRRAGLLEQMEVHAVDPAANVTMPGISFCRAMEALPASLEPDIILLAVKPQQMAGVVQAYAGRFGGGPLYISIAAGITTATLQGKLGAGPRIIRAMPNLPAFAGGGMTALYASPAVSAGERQAAETLFTAVGQVAWIEAEDLMHAVTALSGSGPAYVFLFLEALVEGGVALGLSPALARRLAEQTVVGTVWLAGADAKNDYAAWRQAVTSPGGTTEAALKVLLAGDGIKSLIINALKNADQRSRELSQ